MLRYLKINNLAVIDEAILELGPGFICLTGESGVGKSVLIDALLLLSGARGSSDLVRAGCKKAMVEAEFDIQDAPESMALLAGEEQLFLRREITSEGKSRAFVNGVAVPNATLQPYAELAFEIHGQHGQQRLLKEKNHLPIFDEQTGLLDEVQRYEARLRDFKKGLADYWEQRRGEAQRLKEIDFTKLQIEEIEQVKPNEADEDLDFRLKRAHNRETIRAARYELVELVDERLGRDLGRVKKLLSDLIEFEPKLAPYRDQVADLSAVLQDLRGEVDDDGDGDASEESLTALERRVGELNKLFLKYGTDVAAVCAERDRLKAHLKGLAQTSANLETEWTRQTEAYRGLLAERESLYKSRQKAVAGFVKKISAALGDLALLQTGFEVEHEWPEWPAVLPDHEPLNLAGPDFRFLFSPNPGEQPKPLSKVASGGELSRILLALICSFDRRGGKCLMFDEVDAGVGGETAHAVGAKLAYLGEKQQVLCVTHLAQVAHFANQHIKVSKEVKGGRTFTSLQLCNFDQRIAELARLMGGDADSASLRDHARSLLVGASN